MKILTICLEGATSNLLFGDERCEVLRHLVASSCFGPLTIQPPATAAPGWECLAASQDAGSLGLYGATNRLGRSYSNNADTRVEAPKIWDPLVADGKTVHLIGVPKSISGHDGNGAVIECDGNLAQSAGMDATTKEFVQTYVERQNASSNELSDLQTACARRFALVRHLIEHTPADFTQVHDAGLATLLRSGADEQTVTEYCRFLDEQLGGILEALDESFIICLVSPNGTPRPTTTFHINDWLVEQGYLTFAQAPTSPGALSETDVNWAATKAWAVGTDSAQLYLNVRGREANGRLLPDECLEFREQLKTKLESLEHAGQPLGLQVAKPEETYRHVNGTPPDLLVDPGTGIAGCCTHVGNPDVFANKNGGIGSSGDHRGVFAIISANNPIQDELHDISALDIGPTLLELAGVACPDTMQGKSLVAGETANQTAAPENELSEEELIRQRLSGLGYI